ncbi:TonB-dependent receptor [Novispirillum itersonii]|uniref:Pesticin/yersiniabactin receptor n=1 Tax=Novispirillum itersonii TaxID=189 RepID=A0A7W9ZJA4_NOVIT|nr:TonB-dependent receptor [Novispirillum itersonii]MBB6211617.1 pesticin/yersiniabactin receptor [Novispirillum itersonii]
MKQDRMQQTLAPSAGIIGAAGVAVAALLGLPAPAQAADPASLPTVTVTANKRPQASGATDSSVLVRSGADLEEAGVRTITDLEKVFPGLHISARGSSTYANVSIRGMSSPDFYNPAVQVYVDGVPQDPATLSQALTDVDRVELLKGPQGSLYGAGAYGGVINIITRRPDSARTTVSAGLSTAGQDSRISTTQVLDPGRLYGDLSLGGSWRDGTIDDAATGGSSVDDRQNRDARARLRFAPQGGPLDLAVSASRIEENSNEEVVVSDIHQRSTNSAVYAHPRSHKTLTSLAVNADYRVGPGTISSITAYQDRDLDRSAYGLYQPEQQKTLSQELRYALTGDRYNGVVGLYAGQTDFDRQTGPYFGGVVGASDSSVTTTGTAAFGEGTYHLTPTVDLTAGVRYSYDQAKTEATRANGLMAAYPALSFSNSADFDAVTPKLAAGWQVTPDHRLHAQLSQGYKPGGFNHTVTSAADAQPYSPETSTNAEIGWTGHFAGNRVEVSTTAYWIEAEDKQIYVNVAGSPFQTLRNMGESRSVGLEFDTVVRPVDSLRLTFGGTVGRSTFTSATDPVSNASYTDKRLPYAPDLLLNASATYFLPATGLPGDLSVRGATRYTSRTYFDPANTMAQGGYALFDLSLDLALDSGATVSLFAENLTDRQYRTYSFNGGTTYSNLGDGRVVGIKGGVTF